MVETGQLDVGGGTDQLNLGWCLNLHHGQAKNFAGTKATLKAGVSKVGGASLLMMMED